MATTFWEANPVYNQWNFAFGSIGVLLTVGGFAITFRQLWLTKTAATAAKEASEKTREQLKSLAAFIDMKTLGSHARDMATHIWNGNLESAMLRSVDLREGLARARMSNTTKSLMKPNEWQQTVESISLVQMMAATRADESGKMDVDEKMSCFRTMNELADLFQKLSANVESKIEG